MEFYEKYQGKLLNDYGSICSAEFISFARAFFKEIKKRAEGFEIVKKHIGHYDLFMFLEKNGKYVYLKYSGINRCHVDLNHGVMIRKAKDSQDYSGETNHFPNWENLFKEIESLSK